MPAYSPRSFDDLKRFLMLVPTLFRTDEVDGTLAELPEAIAGFLAECRFAHRLGELNANTSTRASFEKRMYQWFNGFRVLKFMHYAARHHYPKEPVCRAAGELLGNIRRSAAPDDLFELLAAYRSLQNAPQVSTALS